MISVGEAGGDDELSAHFHSQLCLLYIDDGAGTHANLGAVLSHCLDRLGGAGSAEGDLHGVYAAGSHSTSGGDGVFCTVQNDNGHDDGISESF